MVPPHNDELIKYSTSFSVMPVMEEKTPIQNVNLSFACDKDYGKMTPCASGRHCASCKKTIIDFTDKDLPALTQALHEQGSICGRFRKEQVSSIGNQPWNFKRIAAGFLMALGMSSLSKETYAQKIPQDTSQTTQYQPEFFLGMVVETMPEYKGGETAMIKFIRKNLCVPSDTITGTVYIAFTVDTTGKVIDAKIARGLLPETDNESLRVVRLLEFIPGHIRGKKIPIQFTLPIKFGKREE